MDNRLNQYCEQIKEYINKDFSKHFHMPVEGFLKYPYATSGINYSTQVWDWGSWQFSMVMSEMNNPEYEKYQKGNVLNFFELQDEEGRMPIVASANDASWPPKLDKNYHHNCHKPVMATHILEVCRSLNDYEWIRPYYERLKKFISYYEHNLKHEESGLFVLQDDMAIGVDNDPSVFYKQPKSSGFLLFNCLMYSDYISIAEISKQLGKNDEKEYLDKAEKLKQAIQNECYDPIDGYFYSVDLSLRPVDSNEWLHSGHPRFWHSLPIKIKSCVGVFPLYFGLATEEQAKRVIANYLDTKSLYSDYGIRSLGKNEKMYGIYRSNNPSCWLGPVWINFNYFLWEGLKKYGYPELADKLAIQTITMMGKGLEKDGGFYEYYDPENGEGVHGCGMHGWNFLVLKMIKSLQK